jgi:peptidoglycan/xylan/chitin deacetylase (PgdA/CDA1 family)
MNDVLVLCYHAVSESWDSELAVTPAQLDGQLRELLDRGYRPATFLQAATDPPAGKTLAVTFDDAYLSVLELALPVLSSHGVPGSVYAPTDWIGRDEPMRWAGIDQWIGTPDENELTAMSWNQLGQLAEAGWEVGSHTRSHPYLTQLDDDTLRAELAESRAECIAHLGTCETIAYPYGDVDDRVVAAAAATGYTAAGALPHEPHGNESLRWPRVGVYRWDGDRRFRLKVSPTVRRVRRLPVRRALDPIGRLLRSRSPRA